jgi:hypothetical protein
MVLFALCPSRHKPGKLTMHAFSYEHMEGFAANELLSRAAKEAWSTEETAQCPQARIGVRRRGAWPRGLVELFDAAVDAIAREGRRLGTSNKHLDGDYHSPTPTRFDAYRRSNC